MKTTKRLIVAAVFLLIGIICCVAGFAAGGFDIRNIQTEEQYEEMSYTSAAGITRIVVEDSNCPIIVTPSNDEFVHVTYMENDRLHYEFEVEGDTLEIESDYDNKWFNISFIIGERSLRIEVPKEGCRLELETSNGKIAISDLLLTVVDCKSSNGRIELQSVAATKISAKTSNAKISLEEVKVESISAKTSNGKITLDRVEGEDIYLKTSNGPITGTIVGEMDDFSILSDTSNASNNLPNGTKGGDKKLEVDTSNGKINVEFVD